MGFVMGGDIEGASLIYATPLRDWSIKYGDI